MTYPPVLLVHICAGSLGLLSGTAAICFRKGFTSHVVAGKVFVASMLTMGVTGKMLTDWVGAERVTSFGGRFTGQVWPGDTLTAAATVEAIREEDGEHFVDVTISTVNQDGRSVFSGRASARVDP